MDKETIKISELIKELEGWKKELGDVEVFMVNEPETCFDGVKKSFAIQGVRAGLNTPEGFKAVALMRGKDILKI